MEGSLLELYRNLPLALDPTAFQVGFFSVGWYPLMYLVAFSVVYLLLRYRIKRREDKETEISGSPDWIWDFLILAILGVIIGGRLGYVLFYDLGYYLNHPIEIISPYDFSSGRWIGLYGMSYHGGLVGVLLSSWIFSKKNKFDFWQLSDFIVPAVPLGYLFGRIGNFLNGELYGRSTKSVFGMYFFDGNGYRLRHPSQLYEAFFEGLVIFLVLWTIRNKEWVRGKMLFLYIFLYGAFRFFIEFVREPDPQLGLFFGILTMGQILCLLMVAGGLFIILGRKGKMSYH